MLYCFESELMDDPHYSERHWLFVGESPRDINAQLSQYQCRVHVFRGDMLDLHPQAMGKVLGIVALDRCRARPCGRRRCSTHKEGWALPQILGSLVSSAIAPALLYLLHPCSRTGAPLVLSKDARPS